MNANFNLPVLTSTYANFLAEMKSRDEDIAVWFEGTTSTNIPAGTKKWNSTGNKFEKWNGTAWSNLSTLYEIKVRDSDKLNGQTASYYAVSNHGHSAVTTTVNGFMSYTDKVKLNAIAANANNYSHPTGDGNLHVPANGTANNGKFLQATATAGIYAWASLPATSLSTLGVTATAAELNFVDGVTSNIQSQLDSKLYINGTAANANKLIGMNWNWSGQTGQPAWLWGGSDGANMYVYNPVNFSVNYANSAGVANSVSAAVVGAAIAGLSAGAVGSYSFLVLINGFAAPGTTIAGSYLRYSNAGAYAGETPSGTWRCMANATSGQSQGFTTLFLRIA